MRESEAINRERIFQFVNKKEWGLLIKMMKNNNMSESIMNDDILRNFFEKHLINELLEDLKNTQNSLACDYLKYFIILDNSKNNRFRLNADDHKRLVMKLVEIEEDLDRAFYYASKYPDETACINIINKYLEKKAKIIHHPQETEISVTQSKSVANIDASMSLFKSIQEYEFYKGAKAVYQSWLVLPNVALSAVIDFSIIKNTLTIEEKEYFFRALIDCVVINTDKKYIPFKFIELDSKYHDTKVQKEKDMLKDNILSKAGQKLIRIRQKTFKEREKGFEKLIRDTLRYLD